jgi:hypothetical protein
MGVGSRPFRGVGSWSTESGLAGFGSGAPNPIDYLVSLSLKDEEGGLTPLPRRRWTILSNPTKAPDKMKRILLVSTTNVSPFPPAPPPPPPLNPGRPSLTPFFPPGPAPNDRFIGLLGSQFGGSYPDPDPDALGASALVPPEGVEPAVGGEVVEEEADDDVVVDDEIGGGLADRVTFVPSSSRSKACWTPSPPTSLPPPQEPKSLPPLRASLSISSIWIMPILE